MWCRIPENQPRKGWITNWTRIFFISSPGIFLPFLMVFQSYTAPSAHSPMKNHQIWQNWGKKNRNSSIKPKTQISGMYPTNVIYKGANLGGAGGTTFYAPPVPEVRTGLNSTHKSWFGAQICPWKFGISVCPAHPRSQGQVWASIIPQNSPPHSTPVFSPDWRPWKYTFCWHISWTIW